MESNLWNKFSKHLAQGSWFSVKMQHATTFPKNSPTDDLLAVCNYFVAKHNNGLRAAENKRRRKENQSKNASSKTGQTPNDTIKNIGTNKKGLEATELPNDENEPCRQTKALSFSRNVR